MSATRLVSGPLSSAVLKQWCGSGDLGTGTTRWQPETILASPSSGDTQGPSVSETSPGLFSKHGGCCRRKFAFGVGLRVISCGETSFYCLGKESETISAGRQRGVS